MKLAILLATSNMTWIKAEGNKLGIPDEYLEDVLNLLRREKLPSRDAIVAYYTKDPKEQIKFAQSGDVRVVRALANNIQLSPEAQLILAQSSDSYALASLASSKSVIPKVQIILAKSNCPSVQCFLASNKIIIHKVQNILAKSKDRDVQMRLAKNENLCPQARLTLADSPFKEVQEALYQNPHLAKQGHTVPQASNHGLENIMQEAQNLDEAKNQTKGSILTR
jgi:hypothetical protein